MRAPGVAVVALVMAAGLSTGTSAPVKSGEFPVTIRSRINPQGASSDLASWIVSIQEQAKPSKEVRLSIPLSDGAEETNSWCAADKSVCTVLTARIVGASRDLEYSIEVYVDNRPALVHTFQLAH